MYGKMKKNKIHTNKTITTTTTKGNNDLIERRRCSRAHSLIFDYCWLVIQFKRHQYTSNLNISPKKIF